MTATQRRRVQIKTVKAARGTFTVKKKWLQKLKFLAAGSRRCRVTLGELLDAACGINEFLFAREERVAGGADTNAKITPCGTGWVSGPAGASDVGLFVAGMNVSFHGVGKEPSNVLASLQGARQNRPDDRFCQPAARIPLRRASVETLGCCGNLSGSPGRDLLELVLC